MWYEEKESRGGGRRAERRRGASLRRSLTDKHWRKQAASHVGTWQRSQSKCTPRRLQKGEWGKAQGAEPGGGHERTRQGGLARLLPLSLYSNAKQTKVLKGKKKHQTNYKSSILPRSLVAVRSMCLHLGHTFLLSSGSAYFRLGPQIQTKILLQKIKEDMQGSWNVSFQHPSLVKYKCRKGRDRMWRYLLWQQRVRDLTKPGWQSQICESPWPLRLPRDLWGDSHDPAP